MIYGPQQFMKYGFGVSTDASEGMEQTMSDEGEGFYFTTTHLLLSGGGGYMMWRLRPENLSVETPLETVAVKVFPNPTQGLLKVQFSEAVTNGTMTLTNLLGQEVRHQNGLEGNDHQFDFSGMPKGMYILSLNSSSGSFTKKIMIQ